MLPALAIAIGACAGQAPRNGSGAIPELVRPIKPGEVLNYTNSYTGTVTSWAGPTASPTSSPYAGTSQNSTAYAYDSANRIYTSTYSQTGYTKTTYFGFEPHTDGLREIALNDNVTYTVLGVFDSDFFPQGQLVAILPLAKGVAWSDAAADDSTELTQDDAESTTALRDGSYFTQGHGVLHNLPIFSTTLRSDGSGSSVGQSEGYSPSVLTVSLPKRSGSGFVIVGTTQQAVPFPHKPKPAQPFAAADWYRHDEPRPLYFDRTRVVGTVTSPGACGSQSNASTVETVEAYYRLDPIEGFDIRSRTANYYGSHGYVLCQIREITETIYDVVLGKPEARDAEIDRNVLTRAVHAPGAVSAQLASMPIHWLSAPPSLACVSQTNELLSETIRSPCGVRGTSWH
ncbi:MAG: hypothetical protein JO092_07345 [Candidatus Eremiobacteraeota bacterium]|nr:hypothetical protein [Candidatus Eremiobacteraeota bacterium]